MLHLFTNFKSFFIYLLHLLVYDYLSNRKQTVKFNEAISSWKDTEYGVQ